MKSFCHCYFFGIVRWRGCLLLWCCRQKTLLHFVQWLKLLFECITKLERSNPQNSQRHSLQSISVLVFGLHTSFQQNTSDIIMQDIKLQKYVKRFMTTCKVGFVIGKCDWKAKWLPTGMQSSYLTRKSS